MTSEGECSAPFLSPGQSPTPADRTVTPLDRESAQHREDVEQLVATFRSHLRSNSMSDPALESRALIAEQMVLLQRVAARGRSVDPANPTEHMLASEKREFEKRAGVVRTAVVSARAVSPSTLSSQAARLRLLELEFED